MTALNNDAKLWCLLKLTSMLDRLDSVWGSEELADRFVDIRTLCLFVGYPRSGHSVVGSVIDAHPNAVISHRLDSLKYVRAGLTASQIFFLIIRNSERFGRAGRELTGYRYRIPNQWQGRYQQLRVVGDQEGRRTTERLDAEPALLDRLLAMMPIRVRFIHVIRNPFDNITTWAVRSRTSLPHTIRRYFALCDAVVRLKALMPASQMLDIRHEQFVAAFKPSLEQLDGFLDLSTPEAYIRDCTELIRPSRPSRTDKAWTPALIEDVVRHMERIDYLRGYSFET